MKVPFLYWRSFYISRQTIISGNISSDGDGNIAGVVNGDITIRKTLTVEKSGLLNGDVYARKVIVKGIIKGNVYCEEKIYTLKNAEVHGNIFAREATIDKESIVKGSISQIRQKTNLTEDEEAEKAEAILETNMAALANKLIPEERQENWF